MTDIGRIEDLVFVDCEASGLHRTSYPIEIGWATQDLKTESFLVRPHKSWGPEDWSFESEKVHGILLIDCMKYGVDVEEAAKRVNAAFRGKTVLSDAPRYEAMWLSRLFEAARVRPEFQVDDWNAAIFDAWCDRGWASDNFGEFQAKVEESHAHTHRAADDARGMAALYRAVVDERYRAEVLGPKEGPWIPVMLTKTQ